MPRWPDKTGTTKPPRPAHLAELCSECGLYPVHPDYTFWSCEHGQWNLAEDFDNGQQPPEGAASEDELRAAVLASLDEDTLRELLAAKTAPVEDEPPVEKDAKTAAKK